MEPEVSHSPRHDEFEINVVEVVRRIRDGHHELLKGKTPEDKTAFCETGEGSDGAGEASPSGSGAAR